MLSTKFPIFITIEKNSFSFDSVLKELWNTALNVAVKISSTK